jgi:electron transfer flavoprotein alpha/beta subunit
MQAHCARLQTILALLLDEAYLVADRELIEGIGQYAVAMKIYLSSVRRLDEAVVLIGSESRDVSPERELVPLRLAALAAHVVLELSHRGVEGVADRDVYVLV